MYGCFLVPPDDPGADARRAVLAQGRLLHRLRTRHDRARRLRGRRRAGRRRPTDGEVDVVIDVPSGRVTARVERAGGRTRSVAFLNVPSFVHRAARCRCRPAGARCAVDLSYGGATYACARAADLGLAVTPADLTELIAVGREIRDALNAAGAARHPTEPRLAGVYGTIWYDELSVQWTGSHQRNCTVFADGEVDRSPCGSGTSARLALLHADGVLPAGRACCGTTASSGPRSSAGSSAAVEHDRPAVVTEVGAARTGPASTVHARPGRPARRRLPAPMRFIDGSTVHSALSYPDAVAALADALARPGHTPPRQIVETSAGQILLDAGRTRWVRRGQGGHGRPGPTPPAGCPGSTGCTCCSTGPRWCRWRSWTRPS